MKLLEKLKKRFFRKKFICPGAFSQAYIYPDGRVFMCPDCFMSPEAELGNLNNNSFEEIWNSKKAKKIRKEILKGRYNYCSPRFCFAKSNYNIRLVPRKDVVYEVKQEKFPSMVCIGPDAECNASCIMCRKDISRLKDNELEYHNKKIESWYLPILKDAKTLTLSTTSDPFASRHTRLLMKTAAQEYPDLKFNLITNGILCDKFNCDEVGITDRIERIMVSIHASNEQVYNRVVKNGNYQKVIENLEWLKQMKKDDRIKGLYTAFVVSAKNFEDIPSFMNFAKRNEIPALFWPCIDWGGNLDFADEPLNVCMPKHPKRNEIKQLLKTIDLESEYSNFSPAFYYIKNL